MNAAVIAAFVGGWCLAGLLSGVWMARRGYDPLWILVALPLGLMFVPIAIERVQRQPRQVQTTTSSPPPVRREQGRRVRVLVGLDGSGESQQAMAAASDVLGPIAELLVLAEVVHHEAAEDETKAEIGAASRRLAAAAADLDTAGAVHTEVLAGAPGAALCRYAAEHDIDVVVVGRRGRGLSRRVLGSVSGEIIEHSSVPVLVAPHR
ncbi:universal stress protein [Mycobacterium sp. SMC-4]|uniref:universal stress protein n=1 Tax=Mycobacterium sp. SMC-4 TaxID=2857059 RepID=UPI0021B43AD8|nr:universal stress protein [Mycobacterium sp. SMC-4]UXA19010.1 universal stress protein [Mycobacterium sp. SMC-4]